MAAALSILNGHRYCSMGGAPAICVDGRGNPTDCTWKPRRGGRADGMGFQHMRHVADLIDTAYSTDLLTALEATQIRDFLAEQMAMDEALGHPGDDFQRGRRQVLAELTDILTITAESA